MKLETIAHRLPFLTVRLATQTSNGSGVGTGFVVEHRWGEKRGLFIVTNRHVLQDATLIQLAVTAGSVVDGKPQPALGKHITFNVNGNGNWHGHPDPSIDVAVIPFGPLLDVMAKNGLSPFFRAVGTNSIPDSDTIESIGVLAPVVFVGYPVGLFDSKNNLPIVRRGIIATPPDVDFEGKPVFLIDASVFQGSSGSPVMVCDVGGYPTAHGWHVGSRFHLLGLVSETVQYSELSELEYRRVPTNVAAYAKSTREIDVGVVIKARCIVETIDDLFRLAASKVANAAVTAPAA